MRPFTRLADAAGGRGTPAWFPSADGELLLRAALLDGDEALRAWRSWRALHFDEQFDLASFRLLPLVYRNLAAAGASDPDLGRLKGVYRRSWYLAQPLLRHATAAVARLEEAGIPTLLLRGAGLALAHYGDTGARPMDDVDVAVPQARARDALDVLAAAGWRPRRAVRDDDLVVGHAETLDHAEGATIDLHWSVLWDAGDDEELWAAAVPLGLGGVGTRTLCPADQILHACAHAAYWNEIHPLRWVADVHAVARSATDVDWERLVRVAHARELGVPLAGALAYVRAAFGVPVPPEVPGRLRAARVRPLRRAAQRVAALPPSPARSAGLVLVYADAYRRRGRAAGVRPTPSGFVRWLQRHLDVDGVRGLAARGWRSVAASRRGALAMGPSDEPRTGPVQASSAATAAGR